MVLPPRAFGGRTVPIQLRETTDEATTCSQPAAARGHGPADLDALRAGHMRFSALLQVAMRLAQERDPAILLDKLGAACRAFIGARIAVLGVVDDEGELVHYAVCTGHASPQAQWPQLPALWGRVDEVLAQRRTVRLNLTAGDPALRGLPQGFPVPSSLLMVPVASQRQVHGWLTLIDKIDPGGFTLDDESLAATLAAHAGRAYESATLYRDALKRITELETRLSACQPVAAQA
jgi:GAF domain-containing protein